MSDGFAHRRIDLEFIRIVANPDATSAPPNLSGSVSILAFAETGTKLVTPIGSRVSAEIERSAVRVLG